MDEYLIYGYRLNECPIDILEELALRWKAAKEQYKKTRTVSEFIAFAPLGLFVDVQLELRMRRQSFRGSLTIKGA